MTDDPRDHRGLRPMLAREQHPDQQQQSGNAPPAASPIFSTTAAGLTVSSGTIVPVTGAELAAAQAKPPLHDANWKQAALLRVGDLGDLFTRELHAIGATDPLGSDFATPELAAAATKVAEAVMWAKQHISK